MDGDRFEQDMRALEYYHSLRLVPGAWTVLRTDGRSFSRLTEAGFEKPFDRRFHEIMVRAASALLEQLGGVYAYTESDEISLLLAPGWDLFDREVEKAVSVSAGIASAAFTHSYGAPAHFDSRAWIGVDVSRVVDYFRWRQADAARCALNGWAYWTLRKHGQSARAATKALEKTTVSDRNDLLFEHGINFSAVPAWQRRGAGLYWETYHKEGFNPISKETVVATRKRVRVDEQLPVGDAYNSFIQNLVQASA